jgi:hypothetical protein
MREYFSVIHGSTLARDDRREMMDDRGYEVIEDISDFNETLRRL